MTEEDEKNDRLPLLPEKSVPVRINYTKRYDQVSWHSADTDFEPDPSASSADERYRKHKKPSYSKRRKQKIAALVIVVAIFLSVMTGLIYMYVEREDDFVEISCGKIAGVNEDEVFVYKGIQYAKPPLKKFRWEKTVPFRKSNCWKNVFKANTFKSPCLGNRFGSEDCLSLNVYTPVPPKAEQPLLPVIVYFLSELSNQNIEYSKSYLPSTWAVKKLQALIVAVNHRADVFGFLSMNVLWNGTEVYGNYGLYDQVTALDWVKENIMAFGGNPLSITIMGRTTIYALLSSPLAEGKFHRAVALSGSTKFNQTFIEASTLAKHAFMSRGKCKGLGDLILKECLYDLSSEELLDITSGIDGARWDFPDTTSLTKEYIGIVLEPTGMPYPPQSLAYHGSPKIPVMIGNTAQEVGLKSKIHIESWQEFEEIMSKGLKSSYLNFSTIVQLYPNITNSNQTVSPNVLYETISSDLRIICPTNQLVEKMKLSENHVFYRYIFQSSNGAASAVHGDDILSLFNSNNKAGKALRNNLKHFIKYGHPLEFGWDSSNTLLLNDDRESHLIYGQYHKKQCTFWNDPSNGFVEYAWSN